MFENNKLMQPLQPIASYKTKGNEIAFTTEKFLFINKFSTYGGAINAIVEDNTHIYAAGNTTNKIYKYDKATMTKVAESSAYVSGIYNMVEYGDYLYVSGNLQTPSNYIYKYDKATLTKQAQSISVSFCYALYADDTNIYAGTYNGSTYLIYKFDTATLTKQAESSAYGGSINDIVGDTTYIYAAGDTTGKIYKYDKATLTKQAESALYSDLRGMVIDATNIYVGVKGTTHKIYKITTSTLTKVAESVNYGFSINTITDDTDYIYFGGNIYKGTIFKCDKTTMTKQAESAYYGGIEATANDDNFVYVGGENNAVWIINKNRLGAVII